MGGAGALVRWEAGGRSCLAADGRNQHSHGRHRTSHTRCRCRRRRNRRRARTRMCSCTCPHPVAPAAACTRTASCRSYTSRCRTRQGPSGSWCAGRSRHLRSGERGTRVSHDDHKRCVHPWPKDAASQTRGGGWPVSALTVGAGSAAAVLGACAAIITLRHIIRRETIRARSRHKNDRSGLF